MKKKCTPENNAIKIKTPVECALPIVPVVDGCVDPFTHVWNMAVNQAILDETRSVAEHFDVIIDKGLVLSNAENVCCPDCTTNPIYALASVESFLKFAEFMGWLNDDTNQPCCISVQASVETYLKYNEAWQVDQPECCKTDFESCLNKFSTIVNLDAILDKGVVEANGYDGNTLLCKIYELFVNTPEDLLQGSTLSEVFDRILDKGFVAYCCDCNVIISSVETFLKWWEATDGCGTLNQTIAVYSQVLDFGATSQFNSIDYKCNGTTVQSCYSPGGETNIPDLVILFNSAPTTTPACSNPAFCYCWSNYGTYFDNGDGRIRCEMPAAIYNSLCPTGTLTLDIILD
jgi:hypothetical protein